MTIHFHERYKPGVSRLTYPFFIFFFILIITPSNAQTWDFDTYSKTVYEEVLGLKKTSVESLSSFSRFYIINLKETLQLLVNEDESKYSDYQAAVDQRLYDLENSDSESPYKGFYLAELRVQLAFVSIKFGENFTGVWNLRQAYKIISKNIIEYPEFIPNYKTSGLLHIIIGSIPGKYTWLLSLLGMEGTIEQGISELKILSESKSEFNYEADLLLSLVDAYLNQQFETPIERLKKLKLKKDDDLLLKYVMVSVYMKASQSEEALLILNEYRPDQDEFLSFEFLNYLKGEIYLQKGNYKNALYYYTSFIDKYSGINYLKDAHYKVALTYWLDEQPDKAYEFVRLGKIIGRTTLGADKHAALQLIKDQMPNKAIMKIRLATDGGYYHIAGQIIQSLEGHDFTNRKDEIEFIYRKARFLHKTGNLDSAIINYQATIANTENNPWYFAPNASLQLGYIYKEQQDVDLAILYFEKAMAYKNHEYKNSIDNLAKSGLASLEKTE